MCQNLGGDLAVIRSQDENNFIFELLNKRKTVQKEGAWLGLNRKTSAGNAFYWVDDTPLAGHYSAWAYGQPSRLAEKCVQIYPAASYNPGEWNDMLCTWSGADQSQAPFVVCQERLM